MNQKESTDHRLLTEITLHNLLSFGPGTPPLELQNLNILIGPNASGKSNLIEAISLMRATPVSASSNSDLRGVIRRGGGTPEWIWKGSPATPASIEIIAANPQGQQSLRHVISFRDEQGFFLSDERVENQGPYSGQKAPYFYYHFLNGQPVVNTKVPAKPRKLARESVNLELSILAQRRDPETYPEISHLAQTYENVRMYREWAFGRNTVFREPQKADMRNDRLEEDFSNLGLFLNRLSKTSKVRNTILEGLRNLYSGVTDFQFMVEGGTVQVFFSEGEFTVPATRLSDGTLRYLCLLAILCDPTPPPLICIEEPELGLHPDIIPKLADLLVEAAARTQLIVTTHSDILINAMTEHPESIIVCEKHDGKTEMKRLKKEDLKTWLTKYSLGELWITGQIGGNRW